jgi:hypothetical protein
MVVLPSAGASRYHNCCIDSSTSPEYFVYSLVSNHLHGTESFQEKLTFPQPVKQFPTVYGIRTFITALTITRYLSLSWARSIQFIPPHHTFFRSNLILSFHLRLGLRSGLFPSGIAPNSVYTYSLPHTCYMPRLSYSRFDHPNNIGWTVQIIKLLVI